MVNAAQLHELRLLYAKMRTEQANLMVAVEKIIAGAVQLNHRLEQHDAVMRENQAIIDRLLAESQRGSDTSGEEWKAR